MGRAAKDRSIFVGNVRIWLHPAAAIALLADLVVGGCFFIIQPVIYTADTGGYLDAARRLLHLPGANYPYWRTPLFPLLMSVTGVAQGKTLYALIGAQFLMGLAMPLLVYLGLWRINRWFAAALSAAVAISLVPFLNVGYVMPNQFFYFMVAVAFFFGCRLIIEERTRDIYALGLSAFLAVMVRPQGSYLFIVLLAVAVAAVPRKWRHCLAALALVVALQFAYMAARPYFAGPIGPNVVLLSDLSRDGGVTDQNLYRRSLLFTRQNAVFEPLVIAGFIDDPSLARKARLAVTLQALLNRNPDLATQLALSSDDPQLRDEGLFYIAWDRKAAGDEATAQTLKEQIGDPHLRGQLAEVWGRRPADLPVLIKDAPADGRIVPRHYVTGLDLTDTAGKMVLFPALLARNLDPGALIVPENGPATAKLYRALSAYFAVKQSRQMYPQFDYLFAGSSDPAMGVRRLLAEHQALETHWTIWMILDQLYGPAYANGLERSVYFEFAKRHPLLLANLYAGLFFEGLTWHTVFPFAAVGIGFPSHPDIATLPVFKQEIADSKAHWDTYVRYGGFYSVEFPMVANIVLFLAAFGVLAIRERRLVLLWAMSWLLALHQIGICVLTAGVGGSYTAIAWIYIIVAAGISVYAAGETVLRLPERRLKGATTGGAPTKGHLLSAGSSLHRYPGGRRAPPIVQIC